ncbi:MAG: hypothetical protein ACYS83_05415, partial [Planctomycetota bacterium]|jgi:hypothetical protein
VRFAPCDFAHSIVDAAARHGAVSCIKDAGQAVGHTVNNAIDIILYRELKSLQIIIRGFDGVVGAKVPAYISCLAVNLYEIKPIFFRSTDLGAVENLCRFRVIAGDEGICLFDRDQMLFYFFAEAVLR